MSTFDGTKTVNVDTPYGRSQKLLVGKVRRRKVVFLPRHGVGHTAPPHLVNYRANIWALHKLGVERILATMSCGSINPKMRPGSFVVVTQFIDFTKSRANTFYEGGGPGVVHVDMTEPYCPELRELLVKSAKKLNIGVYPNATYVCTEGPRFETVAEIKAFRKLGADLVGMTGVPECVLARELGMCYAGLGIVTNYAAGISKAKLTYTEVAEMLGKNTSRIQKLLLETVSRIPRRRLCSCSSALDEAIVKV